MSRPGSVKFNLPDIPRRQYVDFGDVEVMRDEARGSLTSNGRESIDLSHRGSAGSLTNVERFEIMARNSLPSLQQRRQSTASAFIREPIRANTDDRNWSWRYLRERFRIKDLETLFGQYLLRINHSMLIVYLLVQLFISTMLIITLFITEPTPLAIMPEVTAHGATVVVSMALLLYVYSEKAFNRFPRLHFVISSIIILTHVSIDVALTFYYQEDQFDEEHADVVFGNVVYELLIVYMFLPIQRKWQVTSLSFLLSVCHLTLQLCIIFRSGTDTAGRIVTGVIIIFCVNIVGVYWRFMSEVAFRRAFLDKRGNLESKFKLDAEKKREENLLLSVLPKNIMQQVKSDFRNMIERTLYNTNPISKTNPFPNLYVNRYDMVSILYADICNFTPLTTSLPVDQLVEMLNDLFGKFDLASETYNCLRIKILGDCYYCVSGVPEYDDQHAHNCVKVGLDMIDIIRDVREERSVNVDMRIGIHSGSVLSGLIGVRKWQFDVWSNDVTIANHMEQTGKAGQVHVTQKTRDLLSGLGYEFVPSNARLKDPLLEEEDINTFLIVPKNRRKNHRKISHNYPSASINPRGPIPMVSKELQTLYEGDVTKQIRKVHIPQDGRRASILTRRRSTAAEGAMSKRRTVVTDSALLRYIEIMGNSEEFMEKEIRSMPLSKYHQWFRPEGINPLFLTFTHEKWELLLLRQPDPLFRLYVLCAIIVFFCIFITQLALMPKNIWGLIGGAPCFLLLAIVGPLCWVATVHQRILDPHNDREYEGIGHNAVTSFFYESSKYIITSFNTRATLFILICAGLYICAVVNLVECKHLVDSNTILTNQTTTTIETTFTTTFATSSGYDWEMPDNATYVINDPYLPSLCCSPWYFTYSCTLVLLVAWTFFRVHFLLKLSVYVVAVVVYGYLVLDYANELFSHSSLEAVCPHLITTSRSLDQGVGHLMFVLMIILVLHVMDRQMEYIMRLDFKWKQNLEEEQKEAQTTHFANKLLLQNILPLHVADMYLNRQGVMDELYHESYEHVGVIFASIPNYSEFYKENEMNDEGRMCLRVLNEIISDFDMLTYNAQFLNMEKIKVVGSTYMAACGLQPGRRYSDDSDFEERDRKENVGTIAKFAAAMFEKLNDINEEDLQEFKLRVGIDVGPVIAGVVGAQKPMYDIWGNTVNVASRMDYTGEEGKIHVTAEVAEILKDLGWSVTCRGEINVKGKGIMTTYFVDPTSEPKVRPPSPTVQINNNNNNQHAKAKHYSVNYERRSSQISLSSLKSLLSTHRGSIDINKGKEYTQQSGSNTILKLMRKRRDSSSFSDKGDSVSLASSPRSSVDSKSTESQNLTLHLPSPVEEENGDVTESGVTSSANYNTDSQDLLSMSESPPSLSERGRILEPSVVHRGRHRLQSKRNSLINEDVKHGDKKASRYSLDNIRPRSSSTSKACGEGSSDLFPMESIKDNSCLSEHITINMDSVECCDIRL